MEAFGPLWGLNQDASLEHSWRSTASGSLDVDGDSYASDLLKSILRGKNVVSGEA